jgi:hypothetical protein
MERSNVPPPAPPPSPPCLPFSYVSLAFSDLLVERRGAGALLSDISGIFLSNIWHKEYYFADLSMHVYQYLPREYIIFIIQDRTNVNGVMALVPALLSKSP